MNQSVLDCAILHYSIRICSALFCIILCYSVMHQSALDCAILHYSIRIHSVLFCITLIVGLAVVKSKCRADLAAAVLLQYESSGTQATTSPSHLSSQSSVPPSTPPAI